MNTRKRLAAEHVEITRRYFLGLGAAGIAVLEASIVQAGADGSESLAEATAKLEYLTSLEQFRMTPRGHPPIHALSPEDRRAAGLDPETWRLEVVPDPESDCQVESPLSKEAGTALDWQGLMKLAEKSVVRYLKVMTCTNIPDPMGMGLWEGVPVREAIWLARPKANLRRIWYCGYDNNDPKGRYHSSLSINRVLEDPPGELPVLLAYKLNGQPLTPKAGGPVRLVVPDAYGNRSIKWLERIVLTNSYQANDIYALKNNDVDSSLKTYARFLQVPKTIRAGRPAAITGVAQMGASGLSKVQYCLRPMDAPMAEGERFFANGPWHDAAILPPPERWGGELPGGKLPPVPLQIDPATGKPRQWPLRYAIVHWAALLEHVPAGEYYLLCRTIDGNGTAQPMPRPFPKSGNNAIQRAPLVVEA